MSFEQESIWLNDQFNEGASRYLESWAYRLRGSRIDPAAVRQALTGIVARHEALRSRLALVQGQAWQTVMPAAAVGLQMRQVHPHELPAAMVAAATRPVHLDRPPLLRATLLELSEDDAVLVVAIHHAVIDGWCFSLLDTEFSALYRAALGGTDPGLPALPMQFGPYAKARREADAGDSIEAMKHWREAMHEAPPESTFPTDRPRPAMLSGRGDRIEFTFDADLGADVRRFARAARCTPFAVLGAALTALISRLSEADDVVIGTPISRRDDELIEPMIACLSDVVPLRLRVPADISFAELTQQTTEQVWGAIAHPEVPYTQLVRELGVERSPGRFPLFQVVFGLDDAPAPALDLPGVTAERLYIHSGTAKYDIFLHLVPALGGFDGFLEFSTDLFDRSTAHRLAERLRTLLSDALARPGLPVAELNVLPAAERRLILEEWAPGPPAELEQVLAHVAFSNQAARTPDTAAVRHGDRALSYAQLDQAADEVAAHLVARGMTGLPVGVCLRRSLDVAVAVLGAFKAGCACLPIDPAYPRDRIAYMATDGKIKVALVHRELSDLLPQTVELLAMEDLPAAPPADLPVVSPDDLGYLIYTSGSTGRPKGVAMPHRSLANLLAWQRKSSSAGPGSRTLQFAALSFDVAFQELFSTWATGGTLVMIDEETRRDPARLLDVIESERIERLFLPFVALQQLAEFACATDRSAGTLREVVTAGEQLHATPALRTFFRQHAVNAVLENQYGPSETHVVTAERLDDDPDTWPDLPSVGRPVDGTHVVLLDSHLQLCPIGAVGELHVGGHALADGYLGQPQLTAQKFIEDPFRSGGLLYRTGDLGRYLPDGRIQCLGRWDGQVKIRGHRVETGEVTSALQALPGVAQAVVVTQDLAPVGKRLVAYCLAAAGATLQPESLRRMMAQRLPEYMVPAVFVPLAALPRTASGKLDLAALPLPGERETDSARAAVMPQTGTQRRIAEIWQDLLGPVRVGLNDDFFAVGGHSLLATRLMLRIRQELKVEISLSALSAAPTVGGLAALVDSIETRGPAGNDKSVDLAAEIKLPADIVAADMVVRVAADPAHVLLTGATGFLGAFTVHSLLKRTEAVVHCLVRGADHEQAALRLRQVMEDYGIWDELCERRIRVVLGDLSLPRLGLAEATFDDLALRMDAVYHAGAAVNLISSYAQLKAATVDGTAEVLRLAARHRSVPVHHVSTTGVYASNSSKRIGPAHPTGPAEALEHGYTQSKWVAEGLIGIARARSLPATMYRPTRITGHSRTGACQNGDFMWLMLKGCIQARSAPAGVDTAFDLVPVDYVSDAIVTLSQQASAADHTFHLAAGELVRLDTMLGWLRTRGYVLQATTPQEWLERIGADPGNAAFPLLGALVSEMTGAGSEGGQIFDTNATDSILAASGVLCPKVDETLFGRHIDYFTRTGWLPRAPMR